MLKKTTTVPRVLAVHASDAHDFSQFAEFAVRLIAGLGIEGDAHAWRTVQNRSRVARKAEAVVELTGLRNHAARLTAFRKA